MASLYAMMGLPMPSGASETTGVAPALAMLSAANASQEAQVSALLQATGVSSGGTDAASLTSALLGLSNLDPAAELERLSTTLSSDATSLADSGG